MNLAPGEPDVPKYFTQLGYKRFVWLTDYEKLLSLELPRKIGNLLMPWLVTAIDRHFAPQVST